MKPGSSTAHASHDESLVVRLFGYDVDPAERSRALDLVAGCEECAALYADLGSIATATSALPAPARPRDFTLTPADAARLRPHRPAAGRSRWRGLTRQLGGAFAALGLAGVLMTGALTALAPATATPSSSEADRFGSQGALNVAAAPSMSGQPSAAGPAATGTAMTGAAGSPPTGNAVASPVAASDGASSSSPDITKAAAGSPTASMHGYGLGSADNPAPSSSAAPQGAGVQTPSVGQPPSGGSVDPRLALLIGSAGLLLIGLILLVGPRLRARRVRG